MNKTNVTNYNGQTLRESFLGSAMDEYYKEQIESGRYGLTDEELKPLKGERQEDANERITNEQKRFLSRKELFESNPFGSEKNLNEYINSIVGTVKHGDKRIIPSISYLESKTHHILSQEEFESILKVVNDRVSKTPFADEDLGFGSRTVREEIDFMLGKKTEGADAEDYNSYGYKKCLLITREYLDELEVISDEAKEILANALIEVAESGAITEDNMDLLENCLNVVIGSIKGNHMENFMTKDEQDDESQKVKSVSEVSDADFLLGNYSVEPAKDNVVTEIVADILLNATSGNGNDTFNALKEYCEGKQQKTYENEGM